MLKYLVFLAFLVHGHIRYEDPNRLGLPENISALKELTVRKVGIPSPKLHRSGPSTLNLFWSAFDCEFDLQLKVDKHLYHSSAPESIQRHWSYNGNATLNGWLHGTVSLTFIKDNYEGAFLGTLYIDDVKYMLQPATLFADLKNSEFLMGVERAGEGIDHDVTPPADLKTMTDKHPEWHRRRLNVEYFDNCWPDQDKYIKKLSVGYIVDQDFVDAVKEYMSDVTGMTDREKVTTYVTQVNEDTNQIYHMQLDVVWSIVTIKFPGDDASTNTIHNGLQSSQDGDIGTSLDQLTAWRNANSPSTTGMWKFLTNSFPPPGTVGLAYVGTLCRGYATGVTNFMKENSGGTWSVNAHEGGHIFGAGHSFENGQGSTGGIMDYGDGYYNGIFQFNPLRKSEVCGVLSSTIPNANNAATDCWETLGANDATFQWRKNGMFSECAPLMGEYRFRSTQYDCEVYMDGEKFEASDLECDLSDRPFAEAELCTAVNPTPNCGNEIIEPGEECEPALDGTCCNSGTCLWDVGNDACATSTHRVDAAVMMGSTLYLFNDNMVFRYSNGQENGLDSGYPKEIATEWSDVTAPFSNGVTATMRRQGANEIYLINGLQYQIINVDNGASVSTGTFDRNTLTESSGAGWEDDVPSSALGSYSKNLFVNCGTVTAAISFTTSYMLVCETFYVRIEWDDTFISLRPVSELELLFDDDKVASYVTAAYETNNVVTVYKAGYTVDWQSFRSLSSMTASFPLYNGQNPSGKSSSCASHCTSCRSGSSSTCLACEEGYKLFGTTCVFEAQSVTVDWNTASDSDEWAHLLGGQAQLDQFIEDGKISGNGMQGNGFEMSGTDKIDFAPLNQAWEDFKISTYFRPSAQGTYDGNSPFFTFTDGNEMKIRISLVDGFSGTADMFVEFTEHSLTCLTNSPITTGEWNSLSVEFKQSEIICCTNGNCLARAYSMTVDQLSFSLQDWYVGSTNNGFVGTLDSLSLTVGSLPAPPGTVKKGLLVAVVFILIVGIFGTLGYKYRSEFLDPCHGDNHKREVTNASSSSKPDWTSSSINASSYSPDGARSPMFSTGTAPNAPTAPPSQPKRSPANQAPPKPPGSGLPKVGLPKRGGTRPPQKPAARGPPPKPGKLNMNKFGFDNSNDSNQQLPPPPQKSLY